MWGDGIFFLQPKSVLNKNANHGLSQNTDFHDVTLRNVEGFVNARRQMLEIQFITNFNPRSALKSTSQCKGKLIRNLC